jgi:hypothetical protein
MSEWWTYSLTDFLLFSPRTYYRLFELYNEAIWPAHLAAVALGLGVVFEWRGKRENHGRIIAAILAVCWLWVAWAYFLERYAAINWAAPYFAAAFAIQAMLLLWSGFIRNRLNLEATRMGPALFAFALTLQPLAGPLLGRDWRQMEFFAIAPDPTVVATIGILVAATRIHWHLLAIPLLWCAVTGLTLWAMKAPDALVTPAAGALALLFAAWKTVARNNNRRAP